MRNKTRRDEDMPKGPLRVIRDFLPPPDDLVLPDDHIRVTLFLDRQSVDFFKTHAKRLGSKYQRMMREVLKRYAAHHRSRAA